MTLTFLKNVAMCEWDGPAIFFSMCLVRVYKGILGLLTPVAETPSLKKNKIPVTLWMIQPL